MNQKKETTVQETASLHEKAVQAIASGEVGPTPKPRRKAAQKAATKVQHTKVTPGVWARAQEVLGSGHGYTRIEVIDQNTVVVR